ncbi:MAG: DUF3316 domain-containing protein [Bacteroides sp.]
MRKKITVRSTIIAGLLIFLGTHLNAQVVDTIQAPKCITRAIMYGAGYTNVFDTYLSPQEYQGTEFRFLRESIRMTNLFDGNISVQNLFQAHVGYTHNIADNNNTFSGLVNWNYGLHYQFRLTDNFKLLAGGLTDVNAGFVYNLRNTNNPASARAYINLDLSGMAIWKIRIKKYPLVLRYQANLPVVGLMFSPHYGQSYYEIFSLKNSDGVVKFTTPFNQPALRQMLSIDFPIKNIKMRVSYITDIQQAHINGVKSHTYSHVFMLGWVKNLYKISHKTMDKFPASIKAY